MRSGFVFHNCEVIPSWMSAVTIAVTMTPSWLLQGMCSSTLCLTCHCSSVSTVRQHNFKNRASSKKKKAAIGVCRFMSVMCPTKEIVRTLSVLLAVSVTYIHEESDIRATPWISVFGFVVCPVKYSVRWLLDRIWKLLRGSFQSFIPWMDGIGYYLSVLDSWLSSSGNTSTIVFKVSCQQGAKCYIGRVPLWTFGCDLNFWNGFSSNYQWIGTTSFTTPGNSIESYFFTRFYHFFVNKKSFSMATVLLNAIYFSFPFSFVTLLTFLLDYKN